MQTRRTFLKTICASIGMLGGFDSLLPAAASSVFEGRDVFQRILTESRNWSKLPIGELMGKIARELEGTPYKPGTLEVAIDEEISCVNLNGLDCVTFFETTLDFARMLKLGGKTPEDLLRQIELTRYRDGKRTDYASRLHYTSDWFYDNQKKKTISILKDLPGAEPYQPQVSFMSEHSASYAQLASHPQLVEKIKEQEKLISSRTSTRTLSYVPVSAIAGIEKHLRTGDIVGVCTSIPGLDITHTGIIILDEDGKPRFMHASSSKSIYRVMIKPEPLAKALAWTKTNTGAIFARPLEPN